MGVIVLEYFLDRTLDVYTFLAFNSFFQYATAFFEQFISISDLLVMNIKIFRLALELVRLLGAVAV